MPEKTTTKPKQLDTFYHRKIARSGGSRYLAVGKLVPDDWLIVKIRRLKLDSKICVLELTKLT